MSIKISSPGPVLSEDDKLPAFDFKQFFKQDAGKVRHFPLIADSSKNWLPEEEERDQWKVVRAQWNGTPHYGDDAAGQAVQLWADLSFTKWDLKAPGAISGKKPSRLLEAFNTLFLEVPKLAVSAP